MKYLNIYHNIYLNNSEQVLTNELSKYLSKHFLHDLSLQLSHFTDVDFFNKLIFVLKK